MKDKEEQTIAHEFRNNLVLLIRYYHKGDLKTPLFAVKFISSRQQRYSRHGMIKL